MFDALNFLLTYSNQGLEKKRSQHIQKQQNHTMNWILFAVCLINENLKNSSLLTVN